jgi:phage baseplate assembly protein W
MNPTFGSIIPEIIFDPQTEDLEEAIKDDCIKIINQDPRFELENVNLESYDNGYNISLELNYVPLQQATILSIPFDKRSADARNT